MSLLNIPGGQCKEKVSQPWDSLLQQNLMRSPTWKENVLVKGGSQEARSPSRPHLEL